MQKELRSNIWKFFLVMLTNRRNYLPVLALYFLTLPNTAANQIGLYVGIGWLAGFFLEIPSGYLSDIFGHKKALILIFRKTGAFIRQLLVSNQLIEVGEWRRPLLLLGIFDGRFKRNNG